MKVLVLKAFPYAKDGINAVHLSVGDEPEINDDLIPGLVKEGFVSIPKPVEISPPVVNKPPLSLPYKGKR